MLVCKNLLGMLQFSVFIICLSYINLNIASHFNHSQVRAGGADGGLDQPRLPAQHLLRRGRQSLRVQSSRYFNHLSEHAAFLSLLDVDGNEGHLLILVSNRSMTLVALTDVLFFPSRVRGPEVSVSPEVSRQAPQAGLRQRRRLRQGEYITSCMT